MIGRLLELEEKWEQDTFYSLNQVFSRLSFKADAYHLRPYEQRLVDAALLTMSPSDQNVVVGQLQHIDFVQRYNNDRSVRVFCASPQSAVVTQSKRDGFAAKLSVYSPFFEFSATMYQGSRQIGFDFSYPPASVRNQAITVTAHPLDSEWPDFARQIDEDAHLNYETGKTRDYVGRQAHVLKLARSQKLLWSEQYMIEIAMSYLAEDDRLALSSQVKMISSVKRFDVNRVVRLRFQNRSLPLLSDASKSPLIAKLQARSSNIYLLIAITQRDGLLESIVFSFRQRELFENGAIVDKFPDDRDFPDFVSLSKGS